MNEQPNKKHLSATQISMYLKCPRQYELRYLQGIKLPASGAMVQSRAWHAAVEHNYRQKIKSGTDLRLSDTEDLFVCRLEEALKGEEIIYRDGEDADSLREQGLTIVKAHHLSIAPKVFPWLVEEKFTISLGDDFPYLLTGVWDLIEQDGTIADNKAYGQCPTQSEVNENLQFTVYSLAYRVVQKRVERKLRMDVVIKDTPPRSIQLHTHRTNTDCRRLLKLIEKMAQAISSGNLPPNTKGWWCSPKCCGFWGSRCMEGYGRRYY